MKLFISVVAVSAALATSASAGSVVAFTIPDPVIVAPATIAPTDWGGFYLGGEFGNLGFTVNGAQVPFTGKSKPTGGFLGYNIQRKSVVFGVELGRASASGFVNYNVKGRVGYAFGHSMVYGFLGADAMSFSPIGDYSGLGYGVGAAYKFNNGFFVGLEAENTNLSSSAAPFTIDTTDAAVRIGWQF